MMKRLRWLMLSLVIAALLPGAGGAASLQVTPPPGLIGQEGGESYSVALQGSYAYLGIGPRLAVVDVSAPATPALSGRSAPLPGIVQGVAVSGTTAGTAAGGSGLQIVDVTNPASPDWQGSLDTPGWAYNVAMAGGYAYVADGSGGLRIVDVSDPLAPAEVGSVAASALGGEAKGIAVDGNTAYVGAEAGGLVIVDVTDGANPGILGRYSTGLVATNVVISDTVAYVVDSLGVQVVVVDVSVPTLPELEDSAPILGGVPDDLAVEGSHLYVAVGEAGLYIFQLDPTGEIASYQATYDTPGVGHDVAVAGLYAYVADGRSGLRVVDVVTEPLIPAEVGSYQTLGDALGLAASGGYAYVASGENGLSVMDLADPTDPAQVGSLDTTGYAESAAVAGTEAYVADGNGGLVVVDVTAPASPSQRGQQPMPGSGYAMAVAVEGSYAYVAAESEGMQVVNVSDPDNPSIAGDFAPPGGDEVWDVALDGSYAYLAAGYGGVRVVDISNPAAPAEVAAISTGDYAWAVTVVGGYAYIADIDGGLRIVDVSTPTSPALVTAYTGTLGAVLNVTISGKHALVTTDTALHILDVSVPASPVVRASYETPGTPQAVEVADAVLLTDLDGGLRVLNPADVAVGVSAPVGPQPSEPLTLEISVLNYGPSLATDVQLVDTLPAGVTFGSASPGCTEASGVVTCDIGDLVAGASTTLTITMTPPGSGLFENTSVVSSSATEIYESNNTAVQDIIVGGHTIYLPLIFKQP
jgi:uncharacterized repeat protein (TIGR01451 family)